jgi:hypothetical protein
MLLFSHDYREERAIVSWHLHETIHQGITSATKTIDILDPQNPHHQNWRYAGSARLPKKYTSLSQKPSRAAAPNHRIGPDSESGLNHSRIDVVQAAILADQQINTNRTTRVELKDQ